MLSRRGLRAIVTMDMDHIFRFPRNLTIRGDVTSRRTPSLNHFQLYIFFPLILILLQIINFVIDILVRKHEFDM